MLEKLLSTVTCKVANRQSVPKKVRFVSTPNKNPEKCDKKVSNVTTTGIDVVKLQNRLLEAEAAREKQVRIIEEHRKMSDRLMMDVFGLKGEKKELVKENEKLNDELKNANVERSKWKKVETMDSMTETEKVAFVYEDKGRGGYANRIRQQEGKVKEAKERIRQLRVFQVEATLNPEKARFKIRKARTMIVRGKNQDSNGR